MLLCDCFQFGYPFLVIQVALFEEELRLLVVVLRLQEVQDLMLVSCQLVQKHRIPVVQLLQYVVVHICPPVYLRQYHPLFVVYVREQTRFLLLVEVLTLLLNSIIGVFREL